MNGDKLEPQQILEATQRLKLAGDISRANVILLLEGGEELNVGTISERLKHPRPVTSSHLSLLRVGGLCEALREGRERYYRLTKIGEMAAKWLREAAR